MSTSRRLGSGKTDAWHTPYLNYTATPPLGAATTSTSLQPPTTAQALPGELQTTWGPVLHEQLGRAHMPRLGTAILVKLLHILYSYV